MLVLDGIARRSTKFSIDQPHELNSPSDVRVHDHRTGEQVEAGELLICIDTPKLPRHTSADMT